MRLVSLSVDASRPIPNSCVLRAHRDHRSGAAPSLLPGRWMLGRPCVARHQSSGNVPTTPGYADGRAAPFHPSRDQPPWFYRLCSDCTAGTPAISWIHRCCHLWQGEERVRLPGGPSQDVEDSSNSHSGSGRLREHAARPRRRRRYEPSPSIQRRPQATLYGNFKGARFTHQAAPIHEHELFQAATLRFVDLTLPVAG